MSWFFVYVCEFVKQGSLTFSYIVSDKIEFIVLKEVNKRQNRMINEGMHVKKTELEVPWDLMTICSLCGSGLEDVAITESCL